MRGKEARGLPVMLTSPGGFLCPHPEFFTQL
jgi:hypothetical protein